MSDAARCPRCRVAFEPFVYDAATTIDLCPSCKGAWFDAGELAQVLNTARDLRDLDDELPAAAPDAPLCPRCAGVCLVTVPYASARGAPTLERCPYCEGHFAPLSSLPAMRALAAARPLLRPRTESVAPVETAPPAPRVPASVTEAVAVKVPTVDPDELIDTGPTLRQAALSVPLALAVVGALYSSTIGKLLFHGIRVSVHEFGHASMAWACGHMSIPLPIGITFTTPGRSLSVHLVVLAISAAGVWQGLRARVVAPVVACGSYGLIALACTWGLSEDTKRMLEVFMGCGGEIVYGAALMALGLSRMPKAMRWTSFRWVAFALGACAFGSAALFWREAAADWNLIPWEGGLADVGDMTKLRDDDGWNELQITSRYVNLTRACLAAVVGVQLYAVWRAWQRRSLAA